MSNTSSKQKILIVGATGSTGRIVVDRALELGYEVTAFARSPEKVAQQHPNLTVFQGDVLDPTSVEEAVKGHDAVLSFIGAGLKGTVRSEGTLNIIRAMEKANIRRFISQSTLGAGDSRSNLNFYWKHIMFGLLLRNAYADHHKQEAYIRQSNLAWTIIRPGALTDGERTDTYRHGFGPHVRDLTLDISRADVADFALKQLDDDTYLCDTPGLSY